MRIRRLLLRNYRGIDEREIAFAEQGVTVVVGPNEVGKSSFAEALDLLLEHYDDSKKASVRAVKPVHADVGAEVEAELTAGPYHLTYSKRFHRQTATELRVHAPAPEHLTGREAHERVRAILAETVDLALWRSLRIVQGQVVDQPDLAEVTSLAAALDLAATGNDHDPRGGEREQGLLERVQAEYGRYFTPTGQDNTWLKGVRAEHEAAERDAAEARGALQALEDDVERCAAIARDLDALRPEHQRQAEQLDALERRWAEVERRIGEVERLELAAGRARDALRAVERDAADRERLVLAAAEAAATAERLEARRDVAAPELEAATAAEQEALRTVEHLRERLGHARAAEREAAEKEARARDAFSLELLDERWQRVQAAREHSAEAREVLDTTSIDEEALERIEAAHLTAAQARALLEDEVPVLRLRASQLTELVLDDEALRLAAGEVHEVPVGEELRFHIADVEATVSPGHGLASLRSRGQEAERALAEACAAAGVADLAEARAALRRRLDAERSLEQADRTVRENLRDLTADALEDKLRRLTERVGGRVEQADVDGAKQAREQAERTVRQLEAELDRAEALLRAAAERRGALREAQTGLDVRAAQARQEAEANKAALLAVREAEGDEALAQRVRVAAGDAAAALDTHAAATAALDADDPEGLRAAVENARAVSDKQRGELREREDELVSLRSRLSALGESGLHDRLAAAETRLERAATARRQAERGAAAARLLHDTLQRHRDAARRAYAAPLRNKLEGLGRIVFGPDFAVELDDDLRISRRTLAGLTLDVGNLSSGAREQLAVLTRLAVAAITAHDGGVPVLLDDALGWSDPERLQRLGAAFHLAAKDSQVIVLTCVPDRYRHIGSATTLTMA